MSRELIIATFDHNETAAHEVLERAQELSRNDNLNLLYAAVITRHANGKVEVEEIGDVDAKHGATFGAISGAFIGLIGGPVGAITGAIAGAATGGAGAKLIDFGVSNSTINDVKKGLAAGGSAIIAGVEMSWADNAVIQLENLGATVHREDLDDALDTLGSPLSPQ